MSAIENYIIEQPENQQKIMSFLHSELSAIEGISGKISYRVPFYYRKSWICYLNPVKPDKVELCFVRANEFTNNYAELDFKNRKQVAGILIHNVEDIPLETILDIMNEAVELDEKVKYNVRKS